MARIESCKVKLKRYRRQQLGGDEGMLDIFSSGSVNPIVVLLPAERFDCGLRSGS